MCPFLQKTSPATLRTLSSTGRHASPGGGTMSHLQVLARRCPVMGTAMAVQSAAGLAGVFGGARAYRSKAGLHTSPATKASIATAAPRRRADGGFRSCPEGGGELIVC
jgi:5-aminolevulinate synthase